MKRTQFILSLICLLSNVKAADETFSFLRYTGEDGLTSQEISSLVQDTSGFIWIGTIDGLNRFDGYDFKVYRYDKDDASSVSGNNIGFLEIDHNGTMWVNTDRGICTYNPTTDSFNKPLEGVVINNGAGFSQDDNNHYWIADITGAIIEFDENLNKISEANINSDELNENAGSIYSIKAESKNLLWIATSRGLYKYNTKDKSHYFYHANDSVQLPLIGEVQTLFKDSHNVLWVVTRNRIYYLNPDRTALHELVVKLEWGGVVQDAFTGIEEDDEGYLWFPSGGWGLVRYNRNTNEFTLIQHDPNNDQSISNGAHRFALCDHQGNLWIGGFNTGVSMLQKDYRHFVTVRNQQNNTNSLGNNIVRSFVEGNNGELYIGTDGGGLDIWHRNQNYFEHFLGDATNPEALQGGSVFALHKAENGQIWVGGYQIGIAKYLGEGKFESLLPDPENPYAPLSHDVRGIDEDAEGNIWFVTNGGGMHKLDPFSMQVTKVYTQSSGGETNITNNSCLQIHIDNKGMFWIGTYAGLSIFDPQTETFKNFMNFENDTTSLPANWIFSICERSNGEMWLGTNGGLAKYNRKTETFTNYYREDGLPSNSINGVVEDSQGMLWISTSMGVSQFNPDTKEFSNYNKSDGLQGNEFRHGAYYKTSQNEILFGGTDGFNIIQPDLMMDNPFKPEVYFTAFKLFNEEVTSQTSDLIDKEINFVDNIVLHYDQNVITFDYVGINYILSEGNRYKYRMIGFDKDWNDAGATRSATYTNLSPGKYTFQVIAANKDNLWNETGKRVNIRIKPPWWQTKLFYLFVILVIGYSYYYFAKKRRERVLRDKETLEKKIKEGETALNKQLEEIEKQKLVIKERDDAEREIRYTSDGIAKFSEIIAKNQDNIEQLARKVISELVAYTDADMGIVYILNDTNEAEKFLELKGGFAVPEEILKSSNFAIGEGFVGTCFHDAETLHIDAIPEGYGEIESGLGKKQLTHLYYIPLKQNQLILGVIEIGAFEEIIPYKLSFIEKISENIATVVAVTLSNMKTQAMLEQSKMQAEELQAQEEEMRQNVEEMMATQEEMKRNQSEWISKEEKYEQTIAQLNKELQRYKEESDEHLGE